MKKLRTDSRMKGKNGELEFAKIVAELTEGKILLNRNLEQVRTAGQSDLHGLDKYAIEVKRHKKFTDSDLRKYWIETVNQADQLYPVLAYRPDMQKWHVVVHGNKYDFDPRDIDGTVTISIKMFCEMILDAENVI